MTLPRTQSPGLLPTPPHGADPGHADQALEFSVASDLEQVTDAWSLVYSAYTRIGLIEENPYAIHTTPQAVGPHATVVTGRLGGQSVCTMTTMYDNPMGLPLDSAYRAELDAMRRSGHRLMELGLFADRRERIARSLPVLMELIRWAYGIGTSAGYDCGVIGVHPHHVPFYLRLFGFEQFGAEKDYAAVRNHPVVGLRFDVGKAAARTPRPRGVAYILDHPLPDGFREQRFNFELLTVAASAIGRYLRSRHAQDRSSPLDAASAA